MAIDLRRLAGGLLALLLSILVGLAAAVSVGLPAAASETVLIEPGSAPSYNYDHCPDFARPPPVGSVVDEDGTLSDPAGESSRVLRVSWGSEVRGAAPSGTPGLSGDVRRLAESNITASGDTVLGSYPGYITKANSRGASYFDIGDEWNTLTPAQRTAANNHFLDVIAGRGDRVLLSTPKMQIQAGTALADEVGYLTRHKGYVWVNQWSLRPGG